MSDMVRRGRQELTPEKAVDFVLSLGDPNLIAQVYKQVGWTLTEEAKELLKVARQDGNAAAKLQAIKMLRQMIRDSAEAGGLIAGVTRTIPGAEGSTTVFHAQRIAEALNPVTRKPIESRQVDEETEDDEADGTDTGPDPGCVGIAGTGSRTSAECRTTDDPGGSGSGGCTAGRSPDTPATADGGDGIGGVDADGSGTMGRLADGGTDTKDEQCPDTSNPCVQRTAPVCDHALYPGVVQPKRPAV